jgi:hypothetical protein
MDNERSDASGGVAVATGALGDPDFTFRRLTGRPGTFYCGATGTTVVLFATLLPYFRDNDAA